MHDTLKAFTIPFAFECTLSMHAWTTTAAHVAHCKGSLNLPGGSAGLAAFPSLSLFECHVFAALFCNAYPLRLTTITHLPHATRHMHRFVYMATWSLHRQQLHR
jgi:hypothetical protein